MKTPRLTKDGKLPHITKPQKYSMMSHDIQDLFTERLPNHTLAEVCKYIAGYFYRQQKANEDRIGQLETALFNVIGALEDPTGGQHVLDMKFASSIARAALAGEKKDE